MLYNFFGKKSKELRKLKDMKQDDKIRNLLEVKFDRETLTALLGVDKKEIAEILDISPRTVDTHKNNIFIKLFLYKTVRVRGSVNERLTRVRAILEKANVVNVSVRTV